MTSPELWLVRVVILLRQASKKTTTARRKTKRRREVERTNTTSRLTPKMMKRLIRYLKVQMTDLMALRKRMRKTKRRRLPSLRRSRN
jgi:hypothetical protein